MKLSREVEDIIVYLADSGVPHRITSTYRPGDEARHGMAGTDGDGLAVDFAGPARGDVDAMMRIYMAFMLVAPQLRELIFWDGGTRVKLLVRRGNLVVPTVYAKVLPDHRDHVHVSVDQGTFLQWPKEAPMPDNPDVPNISDVKFFEIVVGPDGTCTGYYLVSSTGEIHSFGPGAPYHGRSEDIDPG